MVNLYSSSAKWKFAVAYSGLAAGTHTIMIKVLGIKGPGATGTKVIVDAFQYLP